MFVASFVIQNIVIGGNQTNQFRCPNSRRTFSWFATHKFRSIILQPTTHNHPLRVSNLDGSDFQRKYSLISTAKKINTGLFSVTS
jgi:hypothetical protein